MKPNTGQPSSSDVQSRSTRVSDRIAEQRERLSKQVDTSQEPLAPKARKRTAEEKQEGPRVKKPALAKSKQPVQEKSTAEGKQRALKPKKPAPAKSRQPVQKKEAKPRHSQVPRVRNIREKALKELERRTANDPLPPDLETWKSDRAPLFSEDPSDSSSKMTAYDPLMPEKLTGFGVFDEMYSLDVQDLKAPSNMQDIVHAITARQDHNPNEVQLRQEYKAWLETILKPIFNEDDAGRYFNGYMDLPQYDPPAPHFLAIKQQWTTPADSQIKTWKPNPDFVEGIAGPQLPEWISTALGSYVRPDVAMVVALPNLIAEFKGKGVMKIAHQQARLDGGFASQGLFKLYEYLSGLGQPYKDLGFTQYFLDHALVGSIEYNGEVMIGNVHWATKSKDPDRKADYHMRRVMGHLTRGLDFKDFVKYRTQARNFRRYFSNVREKIFMELSGLPQPKKPPETYENVAGALLKDMCKLKGITIGKKNVAELRQSLQEDDARRATAVNLSTPGPSHTRVAANSVVTPSARVPGVASPTTPGPSFKRLHLAEQDSEDQASPSSKRHKK